MNFKIVSWNVRGIGMPDKRFRIKNRLSSLRPSIVCLQESKLVDVDGGIIRSLVGSGDWGWAFKPSAGASGGIITCWNEELFDVEAEWVGDFVVVMVLRSKLDDFKWLLLNVYGPCFHIKKLQFLQELRDIVGWWKFPVCMIGDFNLIRSLDQATGRYRSRLEMEWFNNMIFDLALIELPLGGAQFTWSNFQENSSMSRLDRAMVSLDWEQHFSGCTLRALPRTCSDHCPILVECQDVEQIHRPWRFEFMWMEHELFTPFVRQVWEEVVHTPGSLVKLAKKLKILKGKLKCWNRDVFRRVDKEIEQNLIEVDSLDKKEERGELSEDDRRQRINIKCYLDKLWRWEEISWKQKAKENWLKVGDRNTKFFHTVANSKRRMNWVCSISVDGLLVEGQKNVAVAAVNFYQSLYKETRVRRPWATKLALRSLPKEVATGLVRSVSEAEIWEVIKGCGGGKSPGPDGFPMEFFKNYWEIVKEDVCAAVMEFMASSSLPTSINSTFIVLIPKKECVEEFKDFRPISLVGSIYKVISKLLMARLKGCMENLISPQQCAFVSNRQILDAALIANEVIDVRQRSGKPGLVIKLDIEKAYDHVNWVCLINSLRSFGFEEKWIGWIQNCVSSAHFSVLVNGEAAGYFKSSRGLRQGDSLSPFLFILVMEILSAILARVHDSGLVSGFFMDEVLEQGPVSHILYADDALLFCDASVAQWGRFLIRVCWRISWVVRSSTYRLLIWDSLLGQEDPRARSGNL
ncbi:Transposon TX1 uncharacterized 149 kDa protein [Linum grandiflorum]